MNRILHHWDAQAEKCRASPEASWGDNWAIQLEYQAIGKYIKSGDTVLDVGCANGHAVFQHALRSPKRIVGVDFSGKMIEAARAYRDDTFAAMMMQEGKSQLADDAIEFRVGNVLYLPFSESSFDVVYTTRCLINLPTWEEQQRGIVECLRVCKPGGLVLLSEGFWEPLCKLNALRAVVGLPPLVEHDYNRYLKLKKVTEFLSDANKTFTVEDFSSVYYLGSRFLRELVTDPDSFPGYSNPINQKFYELEREFCSSSRFGVQQLVKVNA